MIYLRIILLPSGSYLRRLEVALSSSISSTTFRIVLTSCSTRRSVGALSGQLQHRALVWASKGPGLEEGRHCTLLPSGSVLTGYSTLTCVSEGGEGGCSAVPICYCRDAVHGGRESKVSQCYLYADGILSAVILRKGKLGYCYVNLLLRRRGTLP